MATLDVHPEIHVQEQGQFPDYSTCCECHRSFRAKSEDQLTLKLCNTCFGALRQVHEPVISVHVKVRPHKRVVL